jgi:2-oxoglutarate dehydrogenase E1 component
MDADLYALLDSGFLSLDLIEEQYARYKQNPSSVDKNWQKLFKQLETSEGYVARPPASSPRPVSPDSSTPVLAPEEVATRSVLYHPKIEIASQGSDYRIRDLIDAYRVYGHLAAVTNPVTLKPLEEPEQLKFENYSLTKQDLSAHFPSFGLFEEEKVPLLDIINALKSTYCDRIGVEYVGIHSPELEKWLQQQVEHKRFRLDFTIEQKQMILKLLNKSELFESFIHHKYVGQKRFSLEGAETLIPMLAAIIDYGALHGVEEYVLGMSHRGRLNVLANIFDKSYADIFSEFEEGYIPASVEGSGDVKYHKGFYSQVKTIHGHTVNLTLTPNPSHLESVNPVVEGMTKGKQILRDDIAQQKVLPLLIHGDAAISGQGIVYETMQFNNLEGYSTGGTIHIVINNQIGFTTVPKDSRSTRYCTDIARIFGAPVFHVNAEDPEGCVYAAQLALEIKQQFKCDVFIELMCYRKYGHNETDEPAFTQPIEYQVIRQKQPIREIYRDLLIHQGAVEKNVAEALEAEFKKSLQEAMKTKRIPSKEAKEEKTTDSDTEMFQHIQTGVPKELLKEIGALITHVPQKMAVHPKLAILNKERLAMLHDDENKRGIDWGMGELLAYGTILWAGTDVRLSGQDSCRGTFSHRHAVLMDQVKEEGFVPLKHLKSGQGRFDIYNSPLSEFAVLGFEYGYSVACQDALVIWEAQFGDFSNGAQVIMDQYISTAEQKWSQKSRLTLLLPHGYEGQGPEHSSARIERFLTLAGDYNMQIVNPTTPAQLFHLLRRQVMRPLQKPLVVLTPKGLLRHPACISHLSDFTQGSFQEILEDHHPPKRAKRLILCSGRIYYDLIAERDKYAIEDVNITRIEQLYPLDTERLKGIIGRCSGLKECLWVQEEPSNMGAWGFVRPILKELLPKEVEFSYIGRKSSASPAVGSHAMHKREHSAIMNSLFGAKQPSIFDIAGHFKA